MHLMRHPHSSRAAACLVCKYSTQIPRIVSLSLRCLSTFQHPNAFSFSLSPVSLTCSGLSEAPHPSETSKSSLVSWNTIRHSSYLYETTYRTVLKRAMIVQGLITL